MGTAPSPLQRLLNSNDDEEQEEEDEGGNNNISEKLVPGLAGAVGMAAVCGVAYCAMKPTPERVITIKLKSALTVDQKAKLDKEDEVLFAEGTQIISNFKTVEEFTSKYPGIDVDSHEPRDVAEVKGGDETKFFAIKAGGDLFLSSDKKKYQKTETKAAAEEPKNDQPNTEEAAAEEPKNDQPNTDKDTNAQPNDSI